MSVLLLRLAAPMQSWGLSSRFTERDTGREPTRSGVIGLIAAALGRSRDAPLDDFGALRMGVRIDRDGTVHRDYHTAGGGTWLGEPYGVAKASGARPDTVVSNRYYLADAVFLVGLESSERDFLERIDAALKEPHWPLFLGRKAFPPSEPIHLEGGLLDGMTLDDALRAWPWLVADRPGRREAPPDRLRLVIECRAGEEGEARQDVPLSFRSDARDFIVRHVRDEWVNLSDLPKEVAPCS